ncbi:SPFH domain / Band 7 family protein (fragment) [Desulfamplus magnetovallimortis]|uniref:SPFH domain / Band 7 family protein n=1 Tax=Desulfamplus magnetovallimortis TaxID=1246637 RepID=A0A1W1HL26_9BACT
MKLTEKIKEKSGLIIVAFLILLFFFIFLIDYIFITIYPGEAGVLFKRIINKGTVTNRVYDEGLNVIFPWDKMYVYDIRIHEHKQTVGVLSQNGLTIEVIVSIRYHVVRGELPYLHKMVGPDYLDKIIIPSVISSVREVVGEYKPEEIYTTARHLIQDKLLVEVVEETGRIPIVYDDFIVENIMLPELINDAIEQKLKHQQQYLEYEFRIQKADREIERKEKEAIGIRQYQNIIAESLSSELLEWKGIMATLELAQSSNTKVIIVGSGKNGLPIIFNADTENYSNGHSQNQTSVLKNSQEKNSNMDDTEQIPEDKSDIQEENSNINDKVEDGEVFNRGKEELESSIKK